MKTSEFIRRVEELGYEVVDYVDDMTVCRDNRIFARVSKSKVNKLDTLWEIDIPYDLFDVLVSYAITPIEEREDVKKYCLYNPVKGSYFNYYIELGEYGWLSSIETITVQTQFTQKEIENHKFRDIMELLVKEEVK